ncbi:MAG: 6-phosphogluconolactonase [Gammaproteobacteria bacterium]|nr:MAG: 6-phosphogluconolactonase [Gammaproteobacteria bacterium]
MSERIVLQVHPDRAALAERVAGDIAARLREAVAARGRASLVVSGGSSPVPMYERLAAQALPWEAVTVTLADERWVDPAHPHSNEGLVRRHLLVGPAAAASFVPLYAPQPAPEAAEAVVDARLREAFAGPFDVVVLGMGEDGHTASLFPGAPELEAALSLPGSQAVFAVHPEPLPANAPHPRMSLGLARLFDSRLLVLLFTGAAKRALFERIRREPDARRWPVAALLGAEGPPLHVHTAD